MNRQPASDSRIPPTAGPSAKPSACALPLHADGPPEHRPRHRLGDQRDAVGLQHRGSDGLEHARGDQDRQRRRQAAQRGTDGEHAEPVHVEQLAPDRVGDPADRRDGRDQHQQIRERHPLDRAQARVQVAAHPGQRDRHDARVELAHERADAHGRHHVPVRARALAHRHRPPRLAQQVVPDRPRGDNWVSSKRLTNPFQRFCSHRSKTYL